MRPAVVLVAVSAGGVLGAVARHGLTVAFPHPAGGFPVATFAINILGCLLIGILMAVVDRGDAHPLARPFLGVGVLGGFTTFSTYVVEIQQTVAAGAVALAMAYLAGTVVAAVASVWLGSALGDTVLRGRR